MGLRMTKQDTDRAHRDSYVKLDKQVAPDQPNHKRDRDMENEKSIEPTRKSSRLQEKRQNIPTPTSGAPVDRGSVSTRKRRRGQDGIVETQAKRQKSRNQAQPSRAVDRDAPPLTFNNLKYLSRQTRSQNLSSTKTTLKEWEFVNMPMKSTEPNNPQMSSDAPSAYTIGTSTSLSQRRRLVEDPSYRRILGANNIYMRPFFEEFPRDITRLVDHVRKDRDSPGPSSDQLRQDTDLYDLEMGTAESNVESYFRTKIFPGPKPSDSLKHTDRNPMAKHSVPNVGSKLKVSTPVPDMLYGYNSLKAFTRGQQAQLLCMGNEMVANTQDLIYPFFVVEFKGDGPGGSGSLWVATNQCLGGSASCVKIAESLNRQLRQCKSDEIQPISSAAFSIAMSGTEARLYISWKHNELGYYMQKIKSFALQEPEHYVEFRKYVRNIIDWGKGKRLEGIRNSLDSLLEENRQMASQLAKSRPPHSASSHKRE